MLKSLTDVEFDYIVIVRERAETLLMIIVIVKPQGFPEKILYEYPTVRFRIL